MRYLIRTKEGEVYLTKWFEKENHYVEGMTVVDTHHLKYTNDGVHWKDVEVDKL